jgi:cation:H+ antiporter
MTVIRNTSSPRNRAGSLLEMVWLQFAAVAAVILFAGSNLARYGDVIAEKSGLERSWIGVILLASVTSLPELVTGISAVSVFDVPDIAVGNIAGSCMFNMLILVIVDAFHRRIPATASASPAHLISATLGILLVALAALFLATDMPLPKVAWIGLPSIVLILTYFGAMRLVWNHEKRRVAQFVEAHQAEASYAHLSPRRAYALYGANALLVVCAALFLPGIAERLAETTGMEQSFVGTVFVALSTVLPEAVVALSALRIGAVDMAFGNALGSNMFNIAILGIDDLFYRPGPLLEAVSRDHVVSLTAASAMMAIFVVGLIYRAEKKRLPLSWDAAAVLMIFVLAMLIVGVSP